MFPIAHEGSITTKLQVFVYVFICEHFSLFRQRSFIHVCYDDNVLKLQPESLQQHLHAEIRKIFKEPLFLHIKTRNRWWWYNDPLTLYGLPAWSPCLLRYILWFCTFSSGFFWSTNTALKESDLRKSKSVPNKKMGMQSNSTRGLLDPHEL